MFDWAGRGVRTVRAALDPPSALVRVGVLAALVVLFASCAFTYDFFSDDGYISLRYARNLVEGHGLVFNPGEPVEGFTNLLWVLILAAAGGLGADYVLAAKFLGLLCGAATVILSYRLARRFVAPSREWLAFAAAGIVAVNSALACWAPAGLETALFSLLLVATFDRHAGGHLVSAALLCGATLLSRPEGAIAAGVIGADLLFSRRWKDALAWTGLLLVVLVPYETWRILTYDDWLPNTFRAKVGWSGGQVIRGLAYLRDAALTFGWPLSIALALAGLSRRPAGYAAGVGFLVAYLTFVVAVGGDGLPMHRFIAPAVALMAVAAARGADRLWEALPSGGLRAALVAALALLAGASMGNPEGGAYANFAFHRDEEIPRWTRVGNWLRANATPGDSVACVPVGAIGYYSDLPVIDMVGLTDAHIARKEVPGMGQGWAGHEKHDGAYVVGRRPTFLLLNNVDVTRGPRNPAARPFLPVTNRWIREREGDVFEAPEFDRRYEPASAQIADGVFLNFYRLRRE